LRDPESPNPEAQPDEILLVQNLPLSHDSHALAVMSGATVNLFVIDGRTTPSSRLPELDLLINEFTLPNVQLCLNRDGYAPSPLRVLAMRLGRLFSTRRAPRPVAEPLAMPLGGLDLDLQS